MPILEDENGPITLLTGGSGYVGGLLIPLLERRRGTLRCLARDPEKMRALSAPRPRSCVATCSIVPRWTRPCGASTRPTTSST